MVMAGTEGDTVMSTVSREERWEALSSGNIHPGPERDKQRRDTFDLWGFVVVNPRLERWLSQCDAADGPRPTQSQPNALER